MLKRIGRRPALVALALGLVFFAGVISPLSRTEVFLTMGFHESDCK